ncbi:MAG TPA: hypothetical protein VIM10_13595, partial [Actinopolymorphaceae bacterium]
MGPSGQVLLCYVRNGSYADPRALGAAAGIQEPRLGVQERLCRVDLEAAGAELGGAVGAGEPGR